MSDARHELRDWYGQRLRPKIIEAAQSGAIHPTAAATLDHQMRDLLIASSWRSDASKTRPRPVWPDP